MGLAPDVSGEIVSILAKNKEGFLSVMMIEELQLIPGDESPFINSIVTFFSFALFGLMPLIPFIVVKAQSLEINIGVIMAAIGIAILFFIILGLLKSCVGNQKWYWSVL